VRQCATSSRRYRAPDQKRRPCPACPPNRWRPAGGSFLTVMLGQSLRIFGVDPKPLLQARRGIRLDRVDRHSGSQTPQSMHSSGWNDKHVLTLRRKQSTGQTVDAVVYLHFMQLFVDDVGHSTLRSGSLPHDRGQRKRLGGPGFNCAPIRTRPALQPVDLRRVSLVGRPAPPSRPRRRLLRAAGGGVRSS
jgi:hypothetical protein